MLDFYDPSPQFFNILLSILNGPEERINLFCRDGRHWPRFQEEIGLVIINSTPH